MQKLLMCMYKHGIVLFLSFLINVPSPLKAIPLPFERVATFVTGIFTECIAKLPSSAQILVWQKIRDIPKKTLESLMKKKLEEEKKEKIKQI